MRTKNHISRTRALSTQQGGGPVVLPSNLWAQDAAIAIPILHSRAVSRCLFRIILPIPPLATTCDHDEKTTRNLSE